MEIVEQIFGAYIPLCCLSIPAIGFFILVAALPAAFIALSAQGTRQQEAASDEQETASAK